VACQYTDCFDSCVCVFLSGKEHCRVTPILHLGRIENCAMFVWAEGIQGAESEEFMCSVWVQCWLLERCVDRAGM
jgi:hypothetical protein